MTIPDRLERLTDLVLVLLNAKRPVSLEEIAREVPGYPPSHGARRQAFERDKRLLREEGIPVSTEPLPGAEQFGYRINPDSFYLPDLGLQPDEQAALHLAVAGVHLGDPSGRNALLKLGASGIGDARAVASVVPPEALVPLYDALQIRAEVTFTYRGEPRRVFPTALAFRGGKWYLAGWDRGRSAARRFRVDRIEDTPTIGRPGSATLPEEFDAQQAAPDGPWRIGEADEDAVLLLVDPVEARRVVQEVGERAVEERRPDGSVVLRLGVSSPDVLRSWVLGLLDHAEVLGPPAWRSSMAEWLGQVAAGPTREDKDSSARSKNRSKRTPRGATGDPSEESAGLSNSSQGSDTSARLRRLLAIVGWLARVGEAPIPEVARRFAISEKDLVEELELAACCGVPPYTPDALLEIVVTDRSVRAFLPEDLARPRRLTPAEGLALAAAARTILAVPGADGTGALARGLEKLDAALGDHRNLVVTLDEPSRLEDVRQAVAERQRLEIEYRSASVDETTQRVIDPLAVTSIDGHWYVDAYCHRALDLRRFRVDRILGLEVVGAQEGGPPPGREVPASEAFVPGPGAVVVRLLLDPEAAWVADSVPVLLVEPRPGGRREVSLAVGGSAWLERLLLQVGPHARVLDPPELASVGAGAARRVLARYRS